MHRAIVHVSSVIINRFSFRYEIWTLYPNVEYRNKSNKFDELCSLLLRMSKKPEDVINIGCYSQDPSNILRNHKD